MKPKHLDRPLVAGCSIGHKSRPLDVSRWDISQTDKTIQGTILISTKLLRKGLQLAHINICSLRNKVTEIINIFMWYSLNMWGVAVYIQIAAKVRYDLMPADIEIL